MDAYRGSEAGDVVVAPTRRGTLRLEVGPRSIALRLDDRALHLVDGQLTLESRRERRANHRLLGGLWLARGVPNEELGLWEEVEHTGVRRVFGAEPVGLIEPDGLEALRAFDRLAVRLKAALAPLAAGVLRALELGRGLDKVLVLDDGAAYRVYQRPLFRTSAQWAFEAHRDGRVVLPDGAGRREVVCRSRFGVRVVGDYLWFADADGADLGRVSMPWIGADDRAELARRVGELLHA